MAVYEWTYDVSLSFRGADTRWGFTGNLYNALTRRGIHTFMDDRELQTGEEITAALLKAIEKSRILIPVFSKRYAFSSFCLDELAKICDCFNENNRLVFPVFYDVDACDVRYQIGSYKEAFDKHEERFKDNTEMVQRIQRWRMALHQVANLAGFTFKQGHGYEHEFIGRIIKKVSSKINHASLPVANYPVGLETRVLKVNSLLDLGSDDVVLMIGIFGSGGSGKTALARAVYNYNSIHFEGLLCFLEDVRVNSAKYNLVHLQEMLLHEIHGDRDIKLGNVRKGMSIIKQKLCQQKVLLFVDDVDRIEQLRALVGATDWFGSGSRVIITTRDRSLLEIHGIERTYEVEELNEKEALQLLIWNAFKTDKVDPSYVDFLNRAVSYASGLPLALEVIGSNFYDKGIEDCELAFERFKRIPPKHIQEILQVSFDSLDNDEKTIFLDIACCFGGYKLAEVEDILSAHRGLDIKFIIGVLIEKSLLKVDDGLVTLHELIQHMGREIVRQESEEPGERSRLWNFEDVRQVLQENTGTGKIQILSLDFPNGGVHSEGSIGEAIDWDGVAFKKMKNLRTLVIRNGHFSKGPTHLPDGLRVLKWRGYPSPSLPFDFRPRKLAILEFPDSCLKPSESICRLLLKTKHSLVDMEVPETQFMPKQHLALSIVEHRREWLSSVPAEAGQNVNRGPTSMEGPHQSLENTEMRPRKAQTTQPPVAEAEKGETSWPTPSVERPWEDAGGETIGRHPTTMQNDPRVNEEGRGVDNVELEGVSFNEHEHEESSSNAEGSDSDDPFDLVIAKLSVSGKQTASSGASSRDASLTSLGDAIDALELLMVKDLSEVSSDHTMQSQLDHLLDLLSTSNFPNLTVEVKEVLVEFKRKASASCEEFQTTIEPVNKLKNFEKQRDRILQEAREGKDRGKDMKNSIKEASLAIKAENCRKKELEAEIATLKEQVAMKERDLEQLVLNVTNQEATRSTYLATCASLDEQARELLKEVDDLVTANIGVEEDGKAAEIKQNSLKLTWSTDLASQFTKIQKIFGRCE